MLVALLTSTLGAAVAGAQTTRHYEARDEHEAPAEQTEGQQEAAPEVQAPAPAKRDSPRVFRVRRPGGIYAEPNVEKPASERESTILGDGQSLGGQGMGIQRALEFKPIARNQASGDGGKSASNPPADCEVQDVDWGPGNVNSSAFKTIPAGKTIAYRIYAGQIRVDGQETRIELNEAPESTHMVLSGKACAMTPASKGCQASGRWGRFTVWPAQKIDDWKEPYRSAACAIPLPAGTRGGLDYWYLNVRAEKCSAGVRKEDGGQTSDGECVITAYYYGGTPGSSHGGVADSPSSSGGRPGGRSGSANAVTCKSSNPDGPCYWQAVYSANKQTIACAIPGFSPTHAACGCDPAATSQAGPGPLNAAPCPR